LFAKIYLIAARIRFVPDTEVSLLVEDSLGAGEEGAEGSAKGVDDVVIGDEVDEDENVVDEDVDVDKVVVDVGDTTTCGLATEKF
jgi:hypothetical protein